MTQFCIWMAERLFDLSEWFKERAIGSPALIAYRLALNNPTAENLDNARTRLRSTLDRLKQANCPQNCAQALVARCLAQLNQTNSN